MGLLGDAWNATKKVVRSPVTKAVAGGLAVVYPPVGVPAVAAVATANKALDTVDPKKAKKARKTQRKMATAARVYSARSSFLGKALKRAKSRTQRAKLQKKRRKYAARARAAAHAARAAARRGARIKKARSNLARKLLNSRAEAKRGDRAAQRALSTFTLVSRARKGNPKAIKALKVVMHRNNVGQMVRASFRLYTNGRILPIVGRARMGWDYVAPELGAGYDDRPLF